jgi:hypothetical protein
MEILRIAKACLGTGPAGLLFLLTHDLFSLQWIVLTSDTIICAVFLFLFFVSKTGFPAYIPAGILLFCRSQLP